MKRLLFATLLAAASTAGLTADAPTILSCDGTTTESGRNAPKWVPYNPPANNVEVLTIDGKRLASRDIILFADPMPLCEESAAEFVFSSNCAAHSREYLATWLSMQNPDTAQQQMTHKYGQSWPQLETIRIDRVSLTVSDEFVTPSMDTQLLKKGSGTKGYDSRTQFYASVVEFRGVCKIAKAKI